MGETGEGLLPHLQALYGEAAGQMACERLQALIRDHAAHVPSPGPRGLRERGAAGAGQPGVSERDAILITYPDQVQEPGKPPLQVLGEFCAGRLQGLASAIHILPFYPSTSDDGFAVVDYREVDPAFGNWGHLAGLGQGFRLMFDAVFNHVSAHSAWFQGFLRDDPTYRDYFIVPPAGADLSRVVRPRALPLLTSFDTPAGRKAVWTTFSTDQVDLNYHDPEVLLNILDTLLFYVARGAEFIRLDAIAYMWKEAGTPCIHLPQVHHIVSLFRAALDIVAPHVALITETNVPHADNVAYFGDGYHEAQMVYNFALPPLTLHTFQTGSAAALARWAGGLSVPSPRAAFFNFLASHDGIGLNPARGLLSDTEVDALEERTRQRGGFVSYKDNPDGTRSAYELNINYWDALCDPEADEPLDVQVDRFVGAQAVMLALAGVPGIYFHSLFGLRGWPEGVRQTGQNRTINRRKCHRAELEEDLALAGSRPARVYTRYRALLQARCAHAAFHPQGAMRVWQGNESVLAIVRLAPGGGEQVICLQEVSGRGQAIGEALDELLTAQAAAAREAGRDQPSPAGRPAASWRDLITGTRYDAPGPVSLAPYQTLWLVAGR